MKKRKEEEEEEEKGRNARSNVELDIREKFQR